MKIGVILVTYNRLDCLKIALEKYALQIKKPEYVVVVNNASTDSTKEYLDEWQKKACSYTKHVINSEENLGGSGGFYLGESFALQLDADWIWHADDDAYPEDSALLNIEKCYKLHHADNIVAYCSAVKNVENGSDISWWRKLHKGLFWLKWLPLHSVKSKKYFFVDKFMYLGCVISKEALSIAGLTDKELFIHEDDIEHSIRLRKLGKMIAVTDAIIFHPAWSDTLNIEKINWKFYYTTRNKIGIVKSNFAKRYYVFEVIKAKMRVIIHKLKKYPSHIIEMEKDAIKDAINNVTGKRAEYLPNTKRR